MSIYYGFNPPFVGGQQKYFSRQEDERLIKNDLLQLLLTIPGERVMRPDFGVNLRNVVFEQLDDITIQILREEIVVAIRRYEPRINVLGLTINPASERNGMVISLSFNLKSDPTIVLNINQFIRAGNNV